MRAGTAAGRSRAPTAHPDPRSSLVDARVVPPEIDTPSGATTRLTAGYETISCRDTSPSGRLHSGIQNQATSAAASAGGGSRWNEGSRAG